MKSKKNIVFYFEDKAWFGHACWFKYFFDTLRDEYNILLFFSGNNRKHHFLDGIHTIYLPFFEGYNKDLKEQKCKLIREFLYDFPPDYFFMDYYPFWKFQLRHEMREIIYATKAQGGKVFTFMRDIHTGIRGLKEDAYMYHKNFLETEFQKSISEQFESSEDELLRRLVHNLESQFFRVNIFLEHYLSYKLIDGILVFGDQDIHKLEDEFRLDKHIKKKFHYLWYISPDTSVRYLSKRTKTHKIIVSSGGNITSEKQFLKLLINLHKLKEYEIDIFLWDFVRKEFKDFLIKYFKYSSKIHISGFVPNFRENLIKYDFYFGFGWYGTFLDLLYDGIPAFIFPNFDDKIFADRKLEQENRIKILQGKVNMFPLLDFSIEYIRNLLSREYNMPRWNIRLARDKDIISFLHSYENG